MTHLPKFAEQHQLDPEEALRQAVYAEISDALKWMAAGVALALVLVFVVPAVAGLFL